MGGFAGKSRRQRSANAIASKLVAAGVITGAEKQGIMRHIRATGNFGAMRPLLKLSKPKGARRKAYQVVVEPPTPPKVRSAPKRSQKASFKRKKS